MRIILLSDAEGEASDYLTQNNLVAEQLSTSEYMPEYTAACYGILDFRCGSILV